MLALVVRFPHQNNQKKTASKEAQSPRETSQEENHRPQSKKSPLRPPPHLTAPLPLLLLPHTLFFLSWANGKQPLQIFSPQRNKERACSSWRNITHDHKTLEFKNAQQGAPTTIHMLSKPGKETLLYKKTKKKESNTSRIVSKTTAEGSNLQIIWHTRFEAKVQN